MPISTISKIDTYEKVVALTFDDGPHPDYTSRALNVMDDYGAKGTWFIIGSHGQQHKSLLQAISQSGHDVGNHSWDHPCLTDLTRGQVISQIGRTEELLQECIGISLPYLRPPYGTYNTSILSIADSMGFMWNVLWSVDPKDHQASANQIITRVLSALTPGAIICMHEVNARTTETLPTILNEMAKRGYQSVTLTEMLKLKPEGPSKCRMLAVVTPYISGDDVLAVQEALILRGYEPGPLDGIYGPLTSAAAARFQEVTGLPVTGNVDQLTYSALCIKCPGRGIMNEEID